MNKHWTILLAALPLAAAAGDAGRQAHDQERGDIVVIEEVPPAASPVPAAPDIDVPARGMDMDKVRRIYGDPLNMHSAVGDPPITRWDYENYSVFFEYDKVIHSVVTS